MKLQKCIAILMALMCFLMPHLASAGWDLEVTYQAQEAEWGLYIRKILTDLEQAEVLTNVFSKLLSGMKESIHVGDHALQAVVTHDDQELISGAVQWSDSDATLRSSLWENLLLHMDLSEWSDVKEQAGQQLKALDTEKLTEKLQPLVISFVQSLNMTAEEGRFAGDAYTGGTQCLTVELTESDVLRFLKESLQEMKDDLQGLLDVEETAGKLEDAANHSEFRYKLRYVTTDHQFVGLSLTAFEKDEQVLTLSVGKGEREHVYQIVLGLGWKDEIYYIGTTLEGSINADEDGTQINGYLEANLYTDPFAVGYPALTAWGYSQEMSYSAALTVYDTEGMTTLNLQANQYDPYETYLRESAQYTYLKPEKVLSGATELYQGESETPMLTIDVLGTPSTREIALDDMTDAEVLELSENMDLSVLEKALTNGFSRLLVRLVKILPADILKLMQQ